LIRPTDYLVITADCEEENRSTYLSVDTSVSEGITVEKPAIYIIAEEARDTVRKRWRESSEPDGVAQQTYSSKWIS
jgi:hypothetical protein